MRFHWGMAVGHTYASTIPEDSEMLHLPTTTMAPSFPPQPTNSDEQAHTEHVDTSSDQDDSDAESLLFEDDDEYHDFTTDSESLLYDDEMGEYSSDGYTSG